MEELHEILRLRRICLSGDERHVGDSPKVVVMPSGTFLLPVTTVASLPSPRSIRFAVDLLISTVSPQKFAFTSITNLEAPFRRWAEAATTSEMI